MRTFCLAKNKPRIISRADKDLSIVETMSEQLLLEHLESFRFPDTVEWADKLSLITVMDNEDDLTDDLKRESAL